MSGVSKIIISSLLLAACFVLGHDSADAQERRQIKAADTSSPRDTLRSFIDGYNEIHQLIRSEEFFDRTLPEHARRAERILDCIDVSEIPAFAREYRAAEGRELGVE